METSNLMNERYNDNIFFNNPKSKKNLETTTLNQGRKFNKYQDKIAKDLEKTVDYKLMEGFTPLMRHLKETDTAKQSRKVLTDTELTDQQISELTNLTGQYNDLLAQYTALSETSMDHVNNNIKRMSPENPFLNKNVAFSNGPIMYVNNRGIAKWYPSPEIYANTAGKNGCPAISSQVSNEATAEYNNPSSVIATDPNLIVGFPMKTGQSCGHEGSNVYVDRMVSDPKARYVGCYYDKPAPKKVQMIPIMNSSNNVNGIISRASSVYQGNNDFSGPWAAFDGNKDTFWHSSVDASYLYDANTGVYNGIIDPGLGVGKGEYLYITLTSNMPLTSYNVTGRQGCCGDPNGRDPNTWYIFGLNGAWNQVDYQENQRFNGQTKSYDVANCPPYEAYVMIITICGDPDNRGNRYCVQISEWTLFTTSDASFTNDQRAMEWNPDKIGYTTYENCQQYAADNGYKYFGLQDARPDGTAACLVSNDPTRTAAYGDATTTYEAVPLWSSNTVGTGSMMKLEIDGRLVVLDTAGNIVWTSTNNPPDCWWGGRINPDSISATYGGNCNASGYSVQTNNVGAIVKDALVANNYPISMSINVSNSTFGDPAGGCPKSFDTSFQCGNVANSANIPYAEGQNFVYDCTEQRKSCVFFLTVQDDNNLCIYRGTPTDNKGAVWCTMTNGKAIDNNPNMTAARGKSGNPYISTGDSGVTLAMNEFIGSTSGNTYLIMQTDGNLVLYTTRVKKGCSTINEKVMGGGWINAVYEMDKVGIPGNIGKIGRVDDSTVLKTYASYDVGLSNEYNKIPNFDSWGNDIKSIGNTTADNCKVECDADPNCGGYFFAPSANNTCWVKDTNMYPRGEKQFSLGNDLYVRRKSLKNNDSCSKKITNIDSVQWEKYPKSGWKVSNSDCTGHLTSDYYLKQEEQLQVQMNELGARISQKTNELQNKSLSSSQQIQLNAITMDGASAEYAKVTVDKTPEFNNLNGIINDSDIRVLQENYSYMFWSILAVGTVAISLNVI